MESGPTALNLERNDVEFANVRESFQQNGYLLLPQFAAPELVDHMLETTLHDREQSVEPVEFESDLKYPGAPSNRTANGGTTIRRLQQAHSRDVSFTEWVNSPRLRLLLKELLGPEIVCPLAHHNCIMTKEPQFSSDTGWHQDIRYWSFERPELVSVWLALGKESLENGCLQVVPGSHLMKFDRDRFDDELFFRQDVSANKDVLSQSIPIELNKGDVLVFHCKTLHAATRNHTDATKYSVVFTFRSIDNPPLPGTRSSSLPEFLLH